MTARFIFDPKDGMHDTAAKRIADTLAMGLPDEEITAPIERWNMSRVAESAHVYADALARIEGKL